MLPMFIMLPLPASRIAGTRAWVRKKMCRRLTFRLKSQASGVVARVERRVWAPAEAALFTGIGKLGWWNGLERQEGKGKL
jgi:hypothetical protein